MKRKSDQMSIRTLGRKRAVRTASGVDSDAVDKAALEKKMLELRKTHGELLPRAFIGLDGSRIKNKSGLRFLQFNMLAQGLSSAPLYGGFEKTVAAGKEALDFDNYRKFRVLEEILRSEADVVAVQEMDHFHDFFLPALRHFGYNGAFYPKINSPTLGFGKGNYSDGCSLFWKEAKLSSVQTYELNYDSGSFEVWSQVGLVVRLKYGSESLLVATTHLKAKAPFEKRRTKSVKQLLHLLEARRKPKDHIVLMGDFNTEPFGQGLHTYKTVTSHALDFRSVYAERQGLDEAEYTTCKVRSGPRHHTIDYIFVQPSMTVTALWEIPPMDSLPPHRLPCFAYPSDHLSIGCDVELEAV